MVLSLYLEFKKIMKRLALLSFLVITSITLSSFTISNISEEEPKVGLSIGNKAPELKFKDPNGKEIALSDLKGKMVLIDFWASWCGPCRRENPNVVKTYKEFKDVKFENAKGFTVYSVSLDKNKGAWQNAIMQDGLAWPYHVSDLKAWAAEGAKIYKVRSIPQAYLIDGNGIIVSKGNALRGGGLKATLSSLKK